MNPGKTKDARPSIKLEKTIAREQDYGPDLEPLFVNNFNLSRAGTDVFLDVGIVPIDEVLKAQEKDGGIAPFVVLQRLAMSVNSFVAMRQQVNDLFEKMRGTQILDESLQASAEDGGLPSDRSGAGLPAPKAPRRKGTKGPR